MKNSPKVSVIIPSYNGEATVRACLNSVLAQDFKDFEVIVVDCSADKTPEIIKDEFPEAKLYSFNERIGWGEARNTGIKESKGDYLFFLCIDCVIEKDALSGALRLLESDKELMGISFAIGNHPGGSAIETADFMLEYYNWLPCRKRKPRAENLAGTSSIYKKGAFFNNAYEELETYGEDVILNMRLAERGYNLSFEPSFKAKHINIKKGLFSLLKHQLEVGRSGAVTARRAKKGVKKMLLYSPLLVFMTPFYVVPRMGLTYLTRDDFGNLRFFLRYLHIFFLGNLFWTIGFFKETARQR